MAASFSFMARSSATTAFAFSRDAFLLSWAWIALSMRFSSFNLINIRLILVSIIEEICTTSYPCRSKSNRVSLRKTCFSPGVRKISSEYQKSSCIAHRCTVYDFIAKKEVGCRRNVGRGRSDDISCQIEDVSCGRPRKARKSCYTGSVNL